MKKFSCLILLHLIIFVPNAISLPDYSIVFIHIGDELPAYIEDAVQQARLFNEECPMYVLANQKALSGSKGKFLHQNITLVPLETVPLTKEHKHFLKVTKDFNFKDYDFWRYTKERFLYLHSFIEQNDLHHVFHLENDNMLYVDLEDLLPIFKEKYPSIAATFDNDERGIAGFIYFADAKGLKQFAEFIAKTANKAPKGKTLGKANNDMFMLAKFKKESPEAIDHLPIIMKEYILKEKLISRRGRTVADGFLFAKNGEQFQSIFDAAALGQYFGGTSEKVGFGFISKSCIFNPSFLQYEWLVDSKGRKVPYALYNEKKYRINNLHVHCKNLKQFASIA